MQLLELSLPDARQNLAVDEALLDQGQDVLRLWSFKELAVIVGRGSRVADEVNIAHCDASGIPVLRRCSGGTAVTVGPGCLLYSLILNTERRDVLHSVDQLHQFVMKRIASALSRHVSEVAFQGTCDLTWQNRKFSGNSLRVVKHQALYHGTLLYDFPLDVIEQTLGTPPRQPEYRRDRSHQQFVTNLPLDEPTLRAALIDAFDARQPCPQWPQARTEELLRTRYGDPLWHRRH